MRQMTLLLIILLTLALLAQGRIPAHIGGADGTALLNNLTNNSLNNSSQNISSNLSTLPLNLTFINISSIPIDNNTTTDLWNWGSRPHPPRPMRPIGVLSPEGIRAVIENRGG
jgi:hypothetical protein